MTEEEQGEMVDMAPPEGEFEHRIDSVSIFLQELIVPARDMGHGLMEATCSYCRWRLQGDRMACAMYAKYHMDVVHPGEYDSVKKTFKKVKLKYKGLINAGERRLDDAEAEAKKAKEEYVKKLEKEEDET